MGQTVLFRFSLLLLLLISASAARAAPDQAASPALEREQAFMQTVEGARDPVREEENARQLKLYHNAIERIESDEGAYAADLPEQMLSLGLTLQQQNRHADALKVLKRGIHLARVNDGLYCAQQIPLVRAEIDSLVALGQYTEADERQGYLYQVEVRSLEGGPERADAFLQQAQWQYDAYRLSLGWQGFGRLSNMWDLNALALNELIESEGKTSAALLPPLYGMLRTLYLIADYNPGAGTDMGTAFAGDGYNQFEANRFLAYRSQSYEKGRSVILAIYDVEKVQHGTDSAEAARALVMLGDWAQWNGKEEDSGVAYREAMTELAALDDAKTLIARLFAEPVPLPDLDGLRPLPPSAEAGEGDILLEFAVDPEGSVIDLVRLDANTDLDAQARRLMQELRRTKFRPRFEGGEPVETEKVVRAYHVDG